jgi:drug/metabolite transporter (DMT)-like permease
MTTPAEQRALLQLHACVLLWGFTAILGKLITLPATVLVIWRMGLVAAVLLLWPRVWRGLRAMPRKMILIYSALGILIALHWLTFYASIKLSNASVAVACMALGSVSAAIIDPFVNPRRHDFHEIGLGLLAIPGVLLIVGGVPLDMRLGIAIGILSAILTALFSSLSKRYYTDADPAAITFLEMTSGTMLLVAAGFLLLSSDTLTALPTELDLLWLIVLAMACTLLPFLLWLDALKYITAFTTQLAVNLEPVYAIILAALIFQEHKELSVQFYLGALVVLSTIVLQPLLTRRLTPRTSD